LITATVASLLLLTQTVAFGVTGALTQFPDPNDCIADNAASSCIDGTGLSGVRDIVVARGGKHVYVAAQGSDAIALFKRNRTTGVLTQFADPNDCISNSSAECKSGTGLGQPNAIALSPDGMFVYVSSPGTDSIAAFSRNRRTGKLKQLADPNDCVAEAPGDCKDVTGLVDPNAIIVSPDGKHLYATSTGAPSFGAVVAFKRNKRTGALKQLADPNDCIGHTPSDCADGTGLEFADGLAISSDGAHVYVAARDADGGAVSAFTRDSTTGALTQLADPDDCVSANGGECADKIALSGAGALAVSPDGAHVYVTASSSDAVSVLSRDETSGVLTQPDSPDGCVADVGVITCSDGEGLNGPNDLALTSDGAFLYVTSLTEGVLAAFGRDEDTGVLTQLADPNDCIAQSDADCQPATGMAFAGAVAISPNDEHVYTGAVLAAGGVASFSRSPD
jgi:6-phosphogluconolactonase (cycloisomerase 2 family)